MVNEDRLILVDMFDNELGSAEKLEIHKKGLLHRAFSVFVVHDGKMLLQKRNIKKYHSGGLWTNACCSHPREGEELKFAVSRRLKEELGINFPVKELFDFVYRTEFDNGITEFEYDHVFIADYVGELYPNPNEIAETRWLTFSELQREFVFSPEIFTAWFMIAVPKLLKMLQKTETQE